MLHDIEALAVLLNEIHHLFPHKYKYGYGNKLQMLVSDMVECYHKSQRLVDFNDRSKALQTLLVDIDTIYSLLEIMASLLTLEDDKLYLIYRHMDKIAKQTKGLSKYFAETARTGLPH